MLAVRPKTLPAAIAPVIVGSSIAFWVESFNFWPASACFVVALLLQIGSNLANDVFDYEKGADQEDRLGPTRVTQAGLLTPREVKFGMFLVLGLSAIIGMYLIIIGGWPILLLGIFAVLSAISYTGGPFPYGYFGFGDIFVFIFFGLIAVSGTYYVQVNSLSIVVIGMAVSIGLLTVAILVVNNLRDIEMDRKAKKRTLAVRFGKKFARVEYVFCLLVAYIIPVMLWGMQELPVLVFLIFLTLPFVLKLVRSIYADTGKALNQTLAGTGRLVLLFSILFALGLVLSLLIV
jgi:1,4-dihydroxy-2-naphthoate octaprenyltransferase